MVGKTKHVKAALQSSFDVRIVRPRGMLAAERVGMKICLQNDRFFLLDQKFWLLRWMARASRHFSLLRSMWLCIRAWKPSRSRFSTSSTS